MPALGGYATLAGLPVHGLAADIIDLLVRGVARQGPLEERATA